MRKQSWFAKCSQQWDQALGKAGRSTRSRRRALRKISSHHFVESMEPRILLSVPTLANIADTTVAYTSPMLVGLDGADADGDNLTYTVTTSDSRVTATLVGFNDGVTYNNSLKLDVSYTPNGGTLQTGPMVFELFDNLVGDVTARIEQMVNDGYYDGLVFHRVIDNFVIQAGSYSYGSGYVKETNSYTSFDDQFNADLLHNSTGLLSMAKPTADDSNFTDFFITDFAGSGTDSEQNLRSLDFNHSIFGKIIEGQNIFDAITQVQVSTKENRISGLADAPLSAVTITDASIVQNTQNATLMLKATEDFTGSVTVTVKATDGIASSEARTFGVTVLSDNDAQEVTYTADYNDLNNPTYTYPKNFLNSAPYINSFSDVIVPYNATSFTVSGTATDVDGRSLIKLIELYNSKTYTKTGFESQAVNIFDSDTIPLPLRSDYSDPDTGQADYNAALDQYYATWSTLIDLARFNNDPTLLDLPNGLDYAGYNEQTGKGNKFTSVQYNSGTDILSFDVEINRTDSTLYGTFYILIAQHNLIESDSPESGSQFIQYATTNSDTEIVTIILQPPTPTAITLDNISNGITNDTTPSVTVTGLIDGATLNILDENDNIVATTTVGTSETATLTVSTLAEGSHTLRAIQVVNNADSEAASVAVEINTTVDISGVVYQDINNNNQPNNGEGLQGVNVYVDANGNNQFDEGEIITTTSSSGSYSLTNVPAGAVILHQSLRDGFSQTTPDGTPITLIQVLKDGEATTLNGNATTLDGLTWAGALAMSPDGLFVYGASGNSGSLGSNSDDAIAVFSRNISDGSLTYIQLVKNGINSVAGLNGPNALTVSPDGRHLYVTADDTSSTSDTLVTFSIDPMTGLLTYVATLTNGSTDADSNLLNNLSGIAKVLVSPDDEFVYVASKTSDAITVLSRNRFSGKLTWVQDVVDATWLDGVTQISLSPDGKNLYAGGISGLIVYDVNTTTGQLTVLQTIANVGSGGSGGPYLLDMGQMTVSPDGKTFYAASNPLGSTSDAINIFQRNTPGTLTFVSALTGIAGASGVQINPQGTKLFLTANAQDTLRVYDINSSNGSLTLNQTLTHGGTDALGKTTNGLDGATALLLDPDGNDVYIASRSSNSLSVYSNRNRPWSGSARLLDIDPTSPPTGINFVNAFSTITVESVDYNAQQFNSDDPAGKNDHGPTDWASQRSLIRDITVNFSSQLINFDVAGIQLARIFDVPGNALTNQTVTLNPSDVIVNGDQLLLRNLNLVDGVYELTITSVFDSAIDGDGDGIQGDTYSTYFHQLAGDFNGDRVFNPADLGTLIYWRQSVSDSNSYIDVPGYLDLRDANAAPTPDGRVDNFDLSVFASTFGQFIPVAAVPVPTASLSSPPANQPGNLLAYAVNPPQTASLTLVQSDDEETSQSGLFNQLDNTNLILQLIPTP